MMKYWRERSEKINRLWKRVGGGEERAGNKLLWKLFVKDRREEDE